MDMSSGEWLSHLAMEDPATIINHCQMMMMMNSEANSDGVGLNNLFDPTTNHLMNTQIMNNNLSGANDHQQAISGHDMNVVVKAIKLELLDMQPPPPNSNTNSGSTWGSSISKPSPPSGQLISFGSSDCDADGTVDPTKNEKRKKRVGGAILNLSPQEHVLAERKRREKMTQRFMDLSALIPGLSKMDKASILGDAAKYLKELEERVKLLEEQTAKRMVESVVLVKTVKDPNVDDGNSSVEENNNFNNCTNPLLEIEARASKRNVLIRIHSQKNQGLVQKVLNEIEKLHLTTLNCHIMPFGGYAMNITIIAQMNDDLCMTMKDLAMHLKQALQQYFF